MYKLRITGIDEAIVLAKSQKRLAEMLGVSQQVISKWKKKGYVPVGRVLEIEAQLGVPRERLVEPKLIGLVGGNDGGDL